MGIDSTQLIVAVIRGALVTAVLYFFGERFNRYIDVYSLKNKLFNRIAQKDKKIREFIVKHYWLIGFSVFLINIVILYFIYN